MANKDAIEIFKNSKRLRDIINDHMLKIMMGPAYQDSERYAEKLEQLKSGVLDETYCYLYVPNDV
jgi:hypothetical protein